MHYRGMKAFHSLAITAALIALSVQPFAQGGGTLSEDDCTNPAVIAGTGTWPYSTLNATTGTEGQNETLCDQFGSIIITKDIWFEWTASGDGIATVQSCAVADHDTKIAAYSGAGCPVDGSAIACNDAVSYTHLRAHET